MGSPVYLTLFSKEYLPRAHALLESIYRFDVSARVLACVLDEQSESVLASFPGMEIFDLSTALRAYPEAARAVNSRRGANAIFTAVPSILNYALGCVDQNEHILYLDADTYLFSHPKPIFDELGSKDVGLFAHDFSGPLARKLLRFGRFNAGALVIRNSAAAGHFLYEWQKLCNEWVQDYVEDDKYSNQAYLGKLFEKFQDFVAILSSSGGNVAPWNAGSRQISLDQGHVKYKGNNVTFFHFHGLSRVGSIWLTGGVRYLKFLSVTKLRALYAEYLVSLERSERVYGENHVLPRFQEPGAWLRASEIIRVIATIVSFQYLKKN